MQTSRQKVNEGSGGVSRPLILSPSQADEGSCDYLRKQLRVGTRGSPLALVQADEFVRLLRRAFPKIRIKIVVIRTSGDKDRKFKTSLPNSLISEFPNLRVYEYFGKGLFIKEIEEALFLRRIDVAVHSLKDVPAHLPKGLRLSAFLKRSDPFDIFISSKYKSIKAMPKGASLGTSSPRRAAQALDINPNIKIVPLRGNVETRLRKLLEGECDATIIAAAALKRLNVHPLIVRAESRTVRSCLTSRLVRQERTRSKYIYSSRLNDFIPAIGQGVICAETRSRDPRLIGLIRAATNDKKAEEASLAERAFLQAIGGDCHTPIAAHAKVIGGKMKLTGFVSSPNGKEHILRSVSGSPANELGTRLGNYFVCRGARKMIGLKSGRTTLWTGLSVDDGYLRDPSVIHLPMIAIKPPLDNYRSLNKAIGSLRHYEWVVFTSKNAVEAFIERSNSVCHPRGSGDLVHLNALDSRFRGNDNCSKKPKIAAVGDATAEKLHEWGFMVALKPKTDESSRGLVRMFRELNMKGKRVLFPRAREGLETLAAELRKMGATVDVVQAYRTVDVKIDTNAWKKFLSKNPPSRIFFSSPSGVRSFFRHFGRSSFYKKALMIYKGETTRKALENCSCPIHRAEKSKI